MIPVATMYGAADAAAAILMGAAAITVSPKQAQATQIMRRGPAPCGRRHVKPAGVGPNTEFGKEFAAEATNGQCLRRSSD